MVNEFNQNNSNEDNNNISINDLKCQKTNDGEVTNNKCANFLIKFNSTKIYSELSEDQADSNNLFEHLFDENGNFLIKKLDNLEWVLIWLTKTNDLGRFKLAEKLLDLIQTDQILNVRNLIPIVIQLIHRTKKEEIKQEDELFLQTRKYAMNALDELLRKANALDEQKVNDLLNQLRFFCTNLYKIQINKQNSEKFTFFDLTFVEHPIEAICNLMKISFHEHYRNLICKFGGIETICELLTTEHRYHGFLLENYHQIIVGESTTNIDEKWINTNCITIRRYTAMALTNLSFGDKQSKIQLCLNLNFLDSLLAQLNYLFCEELIHVTSSVLRNLSWKASRICKNILTELNSASILMYCSMQVKKETTLKCILYALWNLSSHNLLNKQMICEVDGSIKFLISLLEYQSTNNTLTIMENSSGVFKNIASFLVKYDHLRKILRRNDCHSILLRQLRSTSLTLVCNSVNILWNVSKNNLVDQKILINLGAIPMLKNLTFSKHTIIATASKETLRNLLTSQCFKSNNFDFEMIRFRVFSTNCLTDKSNLLSQRKRMLLKRELRNSFKEAESINENKIQLSTLNCIEAEQNVQNNFFVNNSNITNDSLGQQLFNIKKEDNLTTNSKQKIEVLDVSHSTSDYFSDLYKDDNSISENNMIEHIKRESNNLKKVDSKIELSSELYVHTNSNMIKSVDFFPDYLQIEESKYSSIYSTISEPIMYYDNNDQFMLKKDYTLNEEILEEEFRKLAKPSIDHDFNFYDSNSIFHAYPVVIQESNEFNENKLTENDLGKKFAEIEEGVKNLSEKTINKERKYDKNLSSSKSDIKKRNQLSNVNSQTKIPVPAKHNATSKQNTKQINQLKRNVKQTKIPTSQSINQKLKNSTTKINTPESKKESLSKSRLIYPSQIKKSKTMGKNIQIYNKLPKSRTTDCLNNRNFELTINDEEFNDIIFENDLTYNVDEKQHNLTYTLPLNESDQTVKNNQQSDNDEQTLVPDEDERTDKNLDELNTYVQNLILDDDLINNEEDDDVTIRSCEINLSIDAESIENLNLIDNAENNGTLLTDSIFLDHNIENAKPPKIYDQINYSVASSLNNSLFTVDEQQMSTKNLKSNDQSKSSRLRSPKAKVWNADRSQSTSPPTNTFTITKSTRSKRSQSAQSKDQAMSTSGYQTSVNSSLLSNKNSINSISAIDKINPPSILNQISGISSLSNSTVDCISNCDSLPSINSDIHDLSINASLDSSFSKNSFKKSNLIKTSTPKHMANKPGISKIVKPITRITKNALSKPNQQNSRTPLANQSKTDTFRKNKAIKKNSTISSNKSPVNSKSDQMKTDLDQLKSKNQESLRGMKIPTSKSLSRISSIPSGDFQLTARKSSKISSLWKKTVSNQQNISSKILKKKSTATSTLDKSQNMQANCTQYGLVRSSTFEKLPSTNQEAIKLSSINSNKNKIRPLEQRQKRTVYQ